MSASNHKEEVDQEVMEAEKEINAQSREVLKDWKLVNEPDPTSPSTQYRFKRAGRNWKLYQSINWVEWWDDFNSSLVPRGQPRHGHRLYRTAWHFICKKTKVSWQRQALWDMIGSEPKLKEGEMLGAPWLGNWDFRRRNGFYVFDDPSKALAVEQAIRAREESIEACKALTPMIAKRLAYWYKIKEQINEAFGGMPLLLDDKVTSDQQLKRANRFFKWQEQVERIIGAIEEQYMKVVGVNPNNPGEQYLRMAETAGRVGAAAALTGAAAAGGHIQGRPMLVQDGRELPLPEDVNYDSILFAQMLQQSEKTYDMPLPTHEKGNGKQRGKTQ